MSRKIKDTEPEMFILRKADTVVDTSSLDDTDSKLAEKNCAQDIEAIDHPTLIDSGAAASENVPLDDMCQSSEGVMPKLRQSKVGDLRLADIMSMLTMPTNV
jgi:hypothetical protein